MFTYLPGPLGEMGASPGFSCPPLHGLGLTTRKITTTKRLCTHGNTALSSWEPRSWGLEPGLFQRLPLSLGKVTDSYQGSHLGKARSLRCSLGSAHSHLLLVNSISLAASVNSQGTLLAPWCYKQVEDSRGSIESTHLSPAADSHA